MIERALQIFYKKFDDHSGEQGGEDRTFSGTDNAALEENQGKDNGDNNAGDVKGDFHVAEILSTDIGDRFDKGLAGIHDDICNDG